MTLLIVQKKLGHWGLTVNSLTTRQQPPFLLCFFACPINFFLYVVFLFLSFFAFTFLPSAQPSQILTVCCTSLFFPGWKCRPLLWQQKGNKESKQRLFSLLSCILLAHSSRRQYACMCVCVCAAALLWLREPESRDKQQHTAARAAQTDLFKLCRNMGSCTSHCILSKIRNTLENNLFYLLSDNTDVPGLCKPRPAHCILKLGQNCRRHTLII